MAGFNHYSRNRNINAILPHLVSDAIRSLAFMCYLEVRIDRSIPLVWVLVPLV